VAHIGVHRTSGFFSAAIASSVFPGEREETGRGLLSSLTVRVIIQPSRIKRLGNCGLASMFVANTIPMNILALVV